MPQETSFALLYKRLLDCHFSPDPQRAGEALDRILRHFPPETREELKMPWKSDESCDTMKAKKRDG